MSAAEAPLTFSVITPAGRGAVAAVSLRGKWIRTEDDPTFPFQSTSAGRRLRDQPLGRIWYGKWRGEEVVVCRLSDDEWEIHCHGGSAAVDAICIDLQTLGGRRRPPAEFQRQSVGALAAEYAEALQRAATWNSAERLLRHPTNELMEVCTGWLSQLASGEAFNFAGAAAIVNRIRSLASFGLHLTKPWSVILVGEPNVGKSSLLNRIAGFERAIVHEEPGTTRDLVAVDCAAAGRPVRFIDSAGIRNSAESLESLGIDKALAESDAADLVLHLCDVSRPVSEAENDLLARWPNALRVAHKCDLAPAEGRPIPSGALRASARTGEGLDDLLEAVVERLIPEEPSPDAFIPVNHRQVDVLAQLADSLASCDAERTSSLLERFLHGTDDD